MDNCKQNSKYKYELKQSLKKELKFSLTFFSISILFSSCFIIKVPISVNQRPINDSVNVYHFIVSTSSLRNADSGVVNSIKVESKRAFDWITFNALKYNQNLLFNEIWVSNKDSNNSNIFNLKLPSKNLKLLSRKNTFKNKIKQRSIEIDWKNALFDSIIKQLNDSLLIRLINMKLNSKSEQTQTLFMIHILKVKKSNTLGFYANNKAAYIGINKSQVIAHEALHYLGAPDLYIHKFWIGKRRRIVKTRLGLEIMNDGIINTKEVENYYLSKFTAFTLGWSNSLPIIYKPLLKENLMARFLYRIL